MTAVPELCEGECSEAKKMLSKCGRPWENYKEFGVVGRVWEWMVTRDTRL